MNARFFFLLAYSFLQAGVCFPQTLKMAPMFSDHMILQQQMPVPVYGTSAAREKVTVSFAGKKYRTTADGEGKWKVMLSPQKATFEGRTMTVSSGNGKIELSDIVVGEIWVAAGQSNMEYTMKLRPTFQKPYKGDDLQAEELGKPENPKIRVYKCNRKGGSKWERASGESLAMISAPGYFCVKNLQDSLSVPVGVISNAVGGTIVESWQKDANWYNNMVAAYVPFAVRGFLWFQGENNCAKAERDYVAKFRKMANQWREEFGVADAPFCTVMLSPHIYSDRKHRGGYVDAHELPRFRQQQMQCIDSVSNTEIIFCPDLVDDLFDIHHSYKWEVGRRLALLALNRTYGRRDIEWSGPRADRATLLREKKGESVTVHFSHTAKGLYKQPEELELKSGSNIRWFEVAGDDGIWYSAIAHVIDKENVKVYCYGVAHPRQIRYLWHETATSSDLRNSDGLPAFPFMMQVEQ